MTGEKARTRRVPGSTLGSGRRREGVPTHGAAMKGALSWTPGLQQVGRRSCPCLPLTRGHCIWVQRSELALTPEPISSCLGASGLQYTSPYCPVPKGLPEVEQAGQPQASSLNRVGLVRAVTPQVRRSSLIRGNNPKTADRAGLTLSSAGCALC